MSAYTFFTSESFGRRDDTDVERVSADGHSSDVRCVFELLLRRVDRIGLLRVAAAAPRDDDARGDGRRRDCDDGASDARKGASALRSVVVVRPSRSVPKLPALLADGLTAAALTHLRPRGVGPRAAICAKVLDALARCAGQTLRSQGLAARSRWWWRRRAADVLILTAPRFLRFRPHLLRLAVVGGRTADNVGVRGTVLLF